MYNIHLHGFIQSGKHQRFDTKENYGIPLCLEEGSLKQAKDLLKAKNSVRDLEAMMGYAVTYLYMSFENHREKEAVDGKKAK